MQPAIPFSFPGIDGDIERLRELFQIGLRTAGWVPRQSPAILNLACGRADETGVLVNALVPVAGPMFLLGIDLRPPEINEARSRWLPNRAPDQQIEFRSGDASRVDRMQQLPPFDFIFIRHQNYWSETEVWTRLLKNALAALKPDGFLAVTSYFDREHELASACLSHLGAIRVADIPHPASRPLGDSPGKSVDRRLAFFRRGPGDQS